MKRRTFTKLTLAGALSSLPGLANAESKQAAAFKSRFGPTFNQLPTAPKAYLDQLKFAHDLGFRGWEDNWLTRRDAKLWPKIAEFCRDNDIALGISVITTGHGIDFSNPGDDGMARLTKDINKGIELAKATDQTCMTFIPGAKTAEKREDQIPKSVDTMHKLCDMVEDTGIIFVQEPVSHDMAKKPPLLRSFADGHLLCKSVNRKSCKLLADFFHEGQIGNGDKLVENAEAVWDQVGYVQYGASPGRKEPGTGKLDYKAVTQFLRDKQYTGVIGMEHGVKGKGKEGLDSLLAAYRKIDA